VKDPDEDTQENLRKMRRKKTLEDEAQWKRLPVLESSG